MLCESYSISCITIHSEGLLLLRLLGTNAMQGDTWTHHMLELKISVDLFKRDLRQTNRLLPTAEHRFSLKTISTFFHFYSSVRSHLKELKDSADIDLRRTFSKRHQVSQQVTSSFHIPSFSYSIFHPAVLFIFLYYPPLLSISCLTTFPSTLETP